MNDDVNPASDRTPATEIPASRSNPQNHNSLNDSAPNDSVPTPRINLAVRIAVVLVGATAIWLAMLTLSRALFDGELSIPARLFNAALISALAVPMVIAARRYLDRRSVRSLGYEPLRGAARPFLIGVIAFAAPSLLGLTVALLGGWLILEPTVPWLHIAGWATLLIVLVFFFEAWPEELIFRGYLQRNLTTVLKPWMAAIVQAVLFTIFGVTLWVITEGWGVLGERGLMFLGIGVIMGLIRIQTGSVWAPIGFHLAFQVIAQSLLSDRVSASSEAVLMFSTIVVSFVLATTIVAFLDKREVNYSTPEPE